VYELFFIVEDSSISFFLKNPKNGNPNQMEKIPFGFQGSSQNTKLGKVF